MKQLFTLSAALLCSIGAYAQQAQKTNSLLPGHAKANPATPTPGKTTGADTRLIATVNFTYGASAFEVEDSAVVSYTGNNGWDYATQGWKFDTGTVWTFDPSTTSWADDGGVKQVLANNRIMSTLFRQRSGSVWQDEQKSSYTYATNGLIASEEYEYNSGSGMEPSSRSTHTYNGDMQITETVHDQWNSMASQWQPSSRMVNYYNTAKLLDTTIQQSWIAMTSQWMDNMRSIYTYTNGKLTQVLQQTKMSGNWTDAYRTNYAYDANGRQSEISNEQWSSLAGIWTKTYRSEYAYNTAGDMIEEKGSSWNGSAYEYQGKTNYTHNQFHHILTEESQTWDANTSQWIYDSNDDYRTVNYYEAYTNDVKNVTSNVANMTAFPVPAKNQITVSASFRQAQPVTIVVRDMSGRIVKQLTEHASANFRKSINVTDIPAGNYIINITGTTEVASKMITIAN